MKKLYSLLAAMAVTVAMNAETANWVVDNLTDYKSGTELDGTTIQIDSKLAVSFSNGSGSSNVAYRKGGSDNMAYIALYSQNIMTITANDAEITKVSFYVDSDSDNPQTASNSTPSWSVKIDNTIYGPGRPAGEVWEGDAESVVVTGNSKTTILGLNIEYTVSGGDTPGGNTGDYSTASLFFTEDMLAGGANAVNPKDFTIEDNGVTLTLKSTSDNAAVSKQTNYFGTADDYSALEYRWQAGSSSNLNSGRYGEFYFPTSGRLYIYAFNNQAAASGTTGRSLQIQQNDQTIYNHIYADTDYAIDESHSTRKIWPIQEVTNIQAGSAYLLWPEGQVQIYGFKFVPGENYGTGIEEVAIDNFFFPADAPAYDIMGRPVGDDYKGIVIQSGKKFIRK